MTEIFIQFGDVKSIIFFIVIGTARPLGFLASFTLFNTTIKKGMLLRIAISMALALPVMVGNISVLDEIYVNNSLVDRAFLPSKEMIVGFLMGTIASLPFTAFKFAGHLADSFRGESSNGLSSEGSETITTGSLIFFLVLSLTFLANDGLWFLFEMMYGSYAIWPIETFLPPLRSSAIILVVDQLLATFMLMIRVGLPLLFILFLVDIFLIFAARVASRFGFNNFNFTAKNLVFLAILPIYVPYVARVSLDVEGDILSASRILTLIFE